MDSHHGLVQVPLPPGHRFPMEKYRRTRQLLQEDPQCAEKILFVPGPQASVEDLLLVHAPEYIDRFKTAKMTPSEVRNLGLPHSAELVGRSLCSSGSTIAATHLVLGGKHTMAANMAGGTHHAFRDRGEGFCVCNDISSAAAVAIRDYGLSRILVVDLDVHQGNGTSSIWEGDRRVVTFDMHGANNYPYSSRMRSTYDIAMADGTTDAQCLPLLEKWLDHLVNHHQPQLMFFQAGVDALQGDSLGRLALTRQGLIRRNNMVYKTCEQASIPLVITMGGGYAKVWNALQQ
ncbi:hypothetical protein DUNSADRAFT_15879 [Dunaliella salina]|uniref:Histone deacetylase domain-containing protein n=1 Tax=Dunaliella salina TaxID=3046 RepID=A0ABQ7G4P4_DUNSA|nr:hypothetical protein DUNSADRAFT_15879 [Dunaliella salina]|eukprot:KAF5829580.1 hypothetical protein DUNSADRAFT_15879 [Dunaliella salina]